MKDIIQEIIKTDLEQLNQIIREDLDSNVFLIKQISEYIISSGGKRIRPTLTLLCGRIAGFKEGNLLHKMAAMIEYIHTATLLHDDVVDGSGMRRGRKTSNAVFGNAASVLVGDFIYTRSFQMMVQSNSLRLLEVMANSTNKISEGEVLQLLNIGRSDLTESEYFKVIDSKTAVLFEASARVAAIIAQTDSKIEENLSNYAKYLGIAFQIVDDILDYTGDGQNMGKNVGDDLLEGKVTLPLIYILQNGNHEEQNIIKSAIENPENSDINLIIAIINTSNAITYCSNIAYNYINQALSMLDIFPESQYKTAMIELSKLAVDRIS
ncbi:MAG: polyprenyl synthetase family protein [Neisseriaceae bacterium]